MKCISSWHCAAVWWCMVLAAVAICSARNPEEGASTQFGKPAFRNTVVGAMAVTFGRPDWQIGFQSWAPTASACTQQVERAAARLGVITARNSIKITPYFFYTWAMPDDQQPNEDKYYRHSVERWLVRDKDYRQVEPTAADVTGFIADFSTCIGTAIASGFRHIFINPMVDPDYNQKDCCPWRNAAEFDPTELLPRNVSDSSSQWSYETLVLQPTLAAVKTAVLAANAKSIQISFGLGAEQGRSWTVFGKQWEVLAKQVQAGLKGMVRMGYVGPHFDPTKLCGYYCDYYSNSTQVTEGQWADFRSFLSTATEFGTSSYPNVWEQYNATTKALDIPQSARLLDTQLQQFAGVSILSLRKAGKRFVFNELGLGGCQWYDCDGTTTPDIYQLSVHAYNGRGSFEAYDTGAVVDTFRYMWTKSFRMEWWRQQLRFFRRITSSAPSYCPDAAFIWSVGSWDVAAIYSPSSKGQDPFRVGCDPLNSYCDPDILSMITDFNRYGSTSARAASWLPGPAYYNAAAVPTRVRSRTVAQEAVALSVDPRSIPGWAQPFVLARPVWG